MITGNEFLQILDCSNRFNNLSRLPLNEAEKGGLTLPEIVMSLKDMHTELNAGTEYEKYSGLFRLISIIVSDHCMRHGEPLKACELGCNSGALSQDISTLLYAFDPDAKYTCVSNSIGNESGMEWVDRIASVSAPSGLSLVVSDFSDTGLKDSNYDVTIINGTVTFEDPVNALKEAVRITKDDGLIVCYSEGQYLLDDGFKLLFAERNEWRFDSTHILFKAYKKDAWKNENLK